MPVPAAVLIPAGVALAQMGAGLYAGYQNRKNEDEANSARIAWEREKMNTERGWALEDWNRNAIYNSPRSQMERFKDAQLNPHLIYGNVGSSPQPMPRATNIGTPEISTSGHIAANQAMLQSASNAADYFMKAKMIENDARLKDAQVLNLQSQAEKNGIQSDLTKATWDDLIQKIKLENSKRHQEFNMLTAQLTNMPTDVKAHERYAAETEKILLQNKHTKELFHLAQQEGKLKQADIDLMEKLAGVRGGDKMIAELLKQIVYGGIRHWSK